jgi:hypothetical protein
VTLDRYTHLKDVTSEENELRCANGEHRVVARHLGALGGSGEVLSADLHEDYGMSTLSLDVALKGASG